MDEEKLGQMVCGIFRGRSYYGFSPSVLKSGVCKYYRRELYDKFIWCVVEMLVFGLKEGGNGLVTNITNRLKILLMEEIVPLDASKVALAIDIIGEMDSTEDTIEKIGKALRLGELVKSCRKGRVVSYQNNWWKYNGTTLDTRELDKIEKYKKKGDTSELLELGELLIEFTESRDERMFEIFNRLYNMETSQGIRYRRKDAIYLMVEIYEDKFGKNPVFMKILDFTKSQLYRKSLKERRAFGVWLMMMVWKYDEIDWTEGEFSYMGPTGEDYLASREKITIDEDFVVNDYHVNKKFGLAKFGKVGSMVVNEDLEILAPNGQLYRDFYQEKKMATTTGKTIKIKKSNGSKKTTSKTYVLEPDESKLEFIDFSRFTNIRVLEEGVCGLKVCCVMVELDGNRYILKEMRKSFNFGRDYILVDSLKSKFGLRDMKMRRIRSNRGLIVKDKAKKSFVGNWQWGEREVVYCIMKLFENIGDLGKNKRFLEKTSVVRECFKIRLFDGLFCSSDNILRNILVNEGGELLSIDEGDIYGKRTRIFNKTDWCVKWYKANSSSGKEMVDEILEEFNLMDKIGLVRDRMEYIGFGDKVTTMEERFSNYREVVFGELL